MDMNHFENFTWHDFSQMAYIDPFSKIQTEKSIIVDVLILPIFSFSTHIHCCIDSARTVFGQKYRDLLINLIFKIEKIITFLNCCAPLGGRDRGEMITIWYLSCQNMGRKIKHLHLLQISYYIFLALYVFIYISWASLLVDYDFSPLFKYISWDVVNSESRN